MKKISLILLACCFVMFASGQSKGKAKKSKLKGTEVQAAGEVKVKYRVVVSFISHASGIDGPKYDAIDNFVKTHAKKPAYDLLMWGREGERDLCFHLKEMNAAEQKTFVEDLKKLAQGTDRVFVNENTERVKKQ
jgi:hypothetical protein